MLINDIKTFVSFIPTAQRFNPDEELSDMDTLKPFLEESETKIINEIIGSDLFDAIIASTNTTIQDALKRIVAINAYYLCIPFVDLISTPNGFAVVSSTNNIAPASKERVERLLDWVKLRLSESTDALIILLLSGTDNMFREEWKKSVHFERYTNCLFITAGDLRRFGRSNASRNTLDELYPLLISYQGDMSNTVSFEYMKELIENRRSDKLTKYDEDVFYKLQVVLGLYSKEKVNQGKELLGTIVNQMIADKDNYTTFMTSQAYKIKTSENYVNQKTDQTFMFNP
ncbi:DUF6712 family protein [Dysgonomonas sp. HGC4]|nr:DUF6712 family protein [Dysgonomonas sp. HGC4]MBD8349341.1 hypothetical protein [Dysgonomonas sp. HGC4]